MFDRPPFYNSTILNVITAFGSMFSNIRFERKNNEGVVEQVIKVPIAYSQKEKWVQAIEQNKDGKNLTYASLPRMGFEVLSYLYDSTRKLPRMNRLSCQGTDGRKYVYTPVPYTIDFQLYFATKTIEDGFQIAEQILPAFTPEYTIPVLTIPELNVKQSIPFSLTTVTIQDDFEGDLETRRFVVHTLIFQAKVVLYGGLNDIGVIKQVEANIEDPINKSYVASQEDKESPIEESWSDNTE